jgi:3,4-dihydroxy 2-butanone 4-phosphate synthase/3,4-dihydroxy 2-butanone 4-phosphate synthase/GTP cyclohydrolase II
VFTGRITETGDVISFDADRITVRAIKTAGSLVTGASVGVSGTCLTVTGISHDEFEAAVSTETRRRTTLGEISQGAKVNLELPLRIGDPLDGHLVQGHVDAVGKIVRVDDEGIGRRLWVRPPARFIDDLVAKGSVALDGVSLTVAEIVRDRFSVALIPATLGETTLGAVTPDQRVNLESDVVGKLARRHGPETAPALAAVVGALPWAGHLTGRLGVGKVVSQLAAGGAVVIWDPNREGEADVVVAGARVRPEAIRFFLTQVCGHTTVPCDLERLERLEIPPLPGGGDRHGTAPHLPVDLASSMGTGVSAFDRAATIRRLAHPEAVPSDFLRPGHIFPLGGRKRGLQERTGHTEASLALCEAAGLPAVAAICEIMGPDGTMAGPDEAERFALRWSLPLVDIADLCTWL